MTNQKTVGIIAEYNPFHNGHLYQLREAKRLSGADFAVAIMSGSFVQRGTPAFLDKMNRTKMALESGIDLVIELPVRYATASAEYFSTGAIALLENLGFIDSLCFGSECGDTKLMKIIAEYIQKDCDDFNKSISKHVKNGPSFPAAREKALYEHCNSIPEDTVRDIISSPNNILGIEYLKALSYFNSNITPFTVKRKQTGYHDLSLDIAFDDDYSIHSATAIRSSLEKQTALESIRSSVPDNVYQLLEEAKTYPVTSNLLSDMLYYAMATSTVEELSSIQDITPDLARTIKNSLPEYEDYEQFIFVLKSKQFTYTRISRCLLHILLGIKKYNIKGLTSTEIAPYARVLGFRRSASVLLKEAKNKSKIPIITKMADAENILDASAYQMLSEDIFATSLYNRLVYQSFGLKGKHDIQTSPIIL